MALRPNVLPTQVVPQRNHDALVCDSRATAGQRLMTERALAHLIEAYLAAARKLDRYRRKAFDEMIDEMSAAAEAIVCRRRRVDSARLAAPLGNRFSVADSVRGSRHPSLGERCVRRWV